MNKGKTQEIKAHLDNISQSIQRYKDMDQSYKNCDYDHLRMAVAGAVTIEFIESEIKKCIRAICCDRSRLYGETLMLHFIDLNRTKHIINMNNVNNVVIRNNDGAYVITFHMPGNHVVPATVDESTATRIHEKLGELK